MNIIEDKILFLISNAFAVNKIMKGIINDTSRS